MKAPLIVLTCLMLVGISFAAPPPAKGRTLSEINVIPKRVLQRSISPWFYKSLLISPIEGWVVVRAQLSGTKLVGERVVRSDLDGAFDPLALQLAKELVIAGNYKVDSQARVSPVLLHLLIYKVADGTMALSFANVEGAGGDQMDYYGCAKLAVLKDDGKWTEIKGPASLQGKGLEVRAPGLGNDLANLMRLEGVNFNGSN
ncbi:MAG: hypothetical protein M3Q89_05095 [Verrucomicrobiota bacterium]|nr:hypothetical protein [Verrucomicrobiota bacterium]